MDLKRVNEILAVCQLAGVDQVIIEPTDKGVVIRGMEPESKSVVFSEEEYSVVENRTYFHRVGDFLKRFALFELDKTKAAVELTGDFAKRITINQGRKRTKLTLSDPKYCKAPKRKAVDETFDEISLTAEQVTELVRAIGTMQPKFVVFASDGEEISYQLTEKGGSDTITDVLTEFASGEEWENRWDTGIFTKVVKAAVVDEESVVLTVTSKGNLYITVNDVQVILVPRIEDDF